MLGQWSLNHPILSMLLRVIGMPGSVFLLVLLCLAYLILVGTMLKRLMAYTTLVYRILLFNVKLSKTIDVICCLYHVKQIGKLFLSVRPGTLQNLKYLKLLISLVLFLNELFSSLIL